VEIAAEIEPEVEEAEVMLEPDDSSVSPVEAVSEPENLDEVSLLEDDTFSPTPVVRSQTPPTTNPEIAPNPALENSDSTVQKIRQTLVSTGDLKPQPQVSETFVVPPSSLLEAQITPENLDTIQDFDIPDDDSLDLDSTSDSLDLGDDLLDDLDDE
jgi:hypothetical protein